LAIAIARFLRKAEYIKTFVSVASTGSLIDENVKESISAIVNKILANLFFKGFQRSWVLKNDPILKNKNKKLLHVLLQRNQLNYHYPSTFFKEKYWDSGTF